MNARSIWRGALLRLLVTSIKRGSVKATSKRVARHRDMTKYGGDRNDALRGGKNIVTQTGMA